MWECRPRPPLGVATQDPGGFFARPCLNNSMGLGPQHGGHQGWPPCGRATAFSPGREEFSYAEVSALSEGYQ